VALEAHSALQQLPAGLRRRARQLEGGGASIAADELRHAAALLEALLVEAGGQAVDRPGPPSLFSD
jgi:hypothetical protein